MGFLLFLPFVLADKGASQQNIGLAMTLVFAGGAAGKLACAFIGARIGADRNRVADRRLDRGRQFSRCFRCRSAPPCCCCR